MPSSIPLHSGNLSVSRTTLRRAMSRKMQEAFAVDIPAGFRTATGGNTTTLIDTGPGSTFWSTKKDWKGSWLYMVSGANAGEERRITTYDASTSTFTVAPAFGSSVSSGHQYEVHSRCSASKKHEALNAALRDAWPDFFTFGVHDAVMCLGETVLATGKGLPSTIRRVTSLRLEPLRLNPVAFTATGGSATTLVLASAGWTANAYAGYSAAIVDGTGQGQQADVLSNTTDTLTLASTLDAAAASGSVVRLKPGAEYTSWTDLSIAEWRAHGAPYLQWMEIPHRWQGQTGRVVRIAHLTDVPALSADEGTTIVPQEYLTCAACCAVTLELGFDGASHDAQWETQMGMLWMEERERLREQHRFDDPLGGGDEKQGEKRGRKE